MDATWIGMLVAVVLLVAWITFRALFVRWTVLEYQRALHYRRGRLVGVLGPGQYWAYEPRTTIVPVDTRLTTTTLSGQEVLSADGLPLKVSLVATYQVVDPAQALNAVADYQGALYLLLQVAAREIIGGQSLDAVLEARAGIGKALLEKATPGAAELGLRLIGADVKDIMLPGEMKRVFAQVVKARKEGEAALELARGETAALRNLANVASVLEAHPSLLQLRALHLLGESGGHTVLLGLSPEGSVLPLRKAPPAAAPPQTEES